MPAGAGEAVSGLRLLVSAGEALPEALFRAWKARFGQEIVDGLGSTEALHIFLSNRPGACTPGSLGCPVPGYELQIVDDVGAPVEPGTVGRLRVRGDSIAAGYWQRAEATRRAFQGGWLVTGDQAIEQTDGTFCLLGRTDDMLKVSGQWVSPPEVEGVIAAVAGVRECAVIGCAGESGLMELVACVVSLPGEEEAVGLRIERACAEGLPRFKRPKRVVFFASLPRTAIGKVQRFVLRDLARVAQR